MRNFDYYCFVACHENFTMNYIFEQQIELGKKIESICNIELKSKAIAKMVKYVLLLFKKKYITDRNFKTPNDFIAYCNHIKPHVESDAKLIEHLDGLYTFSKYTFFGMYKKEIEEAAMIGKFLVYDPEKETFFDMYGNEVDISGKNIFLRTNDMRAKTEQLLAGITTPEEEKILENWFSYIQIGRDIHLTTLRQINDNPTFYFENYIIDNKMFIKTVKKRFSDVCKIEYSSDSSDNLRFVQLNEVDNFYNNINDIDLDEQIIISKPIKTTKDKHGVREWRTFVIDNEMQSISRRDAKESIEIEKEVLELAKIKIQQNIGKIPVNYVMDIMEYIDEFGNLKLDIVEFNPIISSWTFFDNNIVYGPANVEDLSVDQAPTGNLFEMYSAMRLENEKQK